MGDGMDKVSPGQPMGKLPAAAWNTFIDTAREVRRSRRGTSSGGPSSAGDYGVILVKNASGGNLDRFAVVGLDVPTILPSENADVFRDQYPLNGITPATPTHTGKFAILLQPLAANEIGDALVDGVGVVQLDVTASADTLADAANGVSGSLKTGTTGAAQILWKESGTGAGKWAIVRLGGGGSSTAGLMVKVTGSAAGGGKYTGTVWSPPTADVSASGNLSEAELGATGEVVRILNTREVGKSTHDLSSSSYLPLIFEATQVIRNTDGTLVLAIDGLQQEDCDATPDIDGGTY